MAELDIRAVTGGPLDVNTYVVGCEGSDSCVLIDPGAEEARVAEAVGKRTPYSHRLPGKGFPQ